MYIVRRNLIRVYEGERFRLKNKFLGDIMNEEEWSYVKN